MEMRRGDGLRPLSPSDPRLGYRGEALASTGWVPSSSSGDPLMQAKGSVMWGANPPLRRGIKEDAERERRPSPQLLPQGEMTREESEFRASFYSKMPGDLLKRCHAQRHVLPAGTSLARSLSPLGIGASLGTVHGSVTSQKGGTIERMRKYHYDPPGSSHSGLSSPISSVVSPSTWSRKEETKPSAPQPIAPPPAQHLSTSAPRAQTAKGRRPSWMDIDQGYKFDWTATRDRCNISANGTRGQHLVPLKASGPPDSQYLTSSQQSGNLDQLSNSVHPYSRQEAATVTMPESRTCDFTAWEDMNGFADVNGSEPEQMWKVYNDTRRKGLAAEGMQFEQKKGVNAFSPQVAVPVSRGARPLWSQINKGYKCDWGIARERYELHRFHKSDSLRPQTKPAQYFLY